MGNLELVRLGDLGNFAHKSSIKAGDGQAEGKYKFFTSSTEQTKYTDTFLYDFPALIFGTGGCASVHYCDSLFSTSTDCLVFFSEHPQINLKAIYWYLSGNMRLLEEGFRGAGLKHISKNYLANEILIPIFNSPTQDKIADVLDRASTLIEKRRLQLDKLDLLIKSQFIEMFGDDQYPRAKLEDICAYITKGTTPPANALHKFPAESNVPYLKVYNLSDNGGLQFWKEPQYVDKEMHNTVLRRSRVYANDVLMNIVGLPLGKFALVTDDFPEWNVNQAIAIFRSEEKVLPIYLMYAMMQPNVLRPFLEKAVGIRQVNLSLVQCRELTIPLPPIPLQARFADFVQSVEAQKVRLRQSLTNLELNYKSLLQKCFRGELF